MASIRPMRIPGRWREGFVLDYHTVGSIYLGDDEYGHPIFDTTRTELDALSKRLGVRLATDAVTLMKNRPELKNVYDYDQRLSLLADAYKVEPSIVRGQRVLLFDDLYRSGATINAVTQALYDQGQAADVYALAITRTRSRL